MADAEAIAEVSSWLRGDPTIRGIAGQRGWSRPTMRLKAVTSEASQAAAMARRTRDPLVRQRTQTTRAPGARIWPSVASSRRPARRMSAAWPRSSRGDDGALPEAVRDLARLLLDQVAGLAETIAGLDGELRRRASADDTGRGG